MTKVKTSAYKNLSQMLILLLTVGAVFSSPLQPSTHTHAHSHAKNEKQPAGNVGFDPTDLVAATLVNRVFPSKIHAPPAPTEGLCKTFTKEERGANKEIPKTSDEPPLPSDSHRQSRSFLWHLPAIVKRPIRASLVGDQRRTVALSVASERMSQDSFVPPLVFAQKPSNMNLDPTDVEAPEKSPPTESIITEIDDTATNKPSKPTMSDAELSDPKDDHQIIPNKERTKAHQTEYVGGLSKQVSKLSFVQHAPNSSLNLLPATNYSNLDSKSGEIKHGHDDLLQRDDPMVNVPQEKNSSPRHVDSEFKEFKIRTINNTYTLVHEKMYQKLIAADSHLNQANQDKNQIENGTEATKKSISNSGETLEAKLDTGNSSIIVSPAKNPENNEKAEETKQSSRQSKRISSKPIWNVSLDKKVERLQVSENLQNPKLNENQTLSENGTKFAGSNESVVPQGKSGPQRLDEIGSIPQKSEEIKKGKITQENSTIETREVDNNSFFSNINSEISSKRVKKVDIRPSSDGLQKKAVEGNVHKFGGITSSSEVSYKQFVPAAKNGSHPVERHGSLNSKPQGVFIEANETKLNFEQVGEFSPKYLEENYKPNINTTKSGNGKNIKLQINVIRGKNETTSVTSKDPTVTSLPSQTSVVEPIRANSSSSLTEVTLPSSNHRTKSEHSANSNPLPSHVKSDIIGSYPIELHPKVYPSQGKGTSEIPMGQSDPVSHHVYGGISSACVAAIVVGVLLIMAIIGGAVTYIVHQRLEGFQPKILSSDRSSANSDSGGYLDDQSRLAYVNSQIDLPKNTPEDLVSLDNDSFLNSLESMTIQNLWTDSIRHTKL